MPAPFIDDPEQWPDGAAEMCVLADEMKDESARTMMFEPADDYDKFDNRAHERGSEPPRTTSPI